MSKLANKNSSKDQHPSDIWSAIHDNLTDLSLEYKSTSEAFQMVSKEASETPSIPYKIFTKDDIDDFLTIIEDTAEEVGAIRGIKTFI